MLQPGDMLGTYEIEAPLGRGGMGFVYRAFDLRLERKVALKVIAREEDTAPPEMVARLLREARAVASLNHPNVVAIYEAGEADGQLYLAMELVEGPTLRQLVASTSAAPSERVRWLADIARALDAAHRKGIVHRDVKPENVVLRSDGVIKVLDFGIARRATRPVDGVTSRREHKDETDTERGAVTGTPVYMAPEQIRGEDVDARADQFSWAVVAFELLTGSRPWAETQELYPVLAKILTDPFPTERLASADVPVAVVETIARAAEKERTARFDSMGAIVDTLEPFASRDRSVERVITIASTDPAPEDAAFAATTRLATTVTPRPEAVAPSGRSRRRWRMRLIVPALVAGAALGAFAFRGKGSVPPAALDGGARPLGSATGGAPLPREEREAAKRTEAGLQLWHDGASERAAQSFEAAVALDASQATAHLALALLRYVDDPVSAQAHFQAAFQHRAKLGPRDAAVLQASEPFVRTVPDLREWERRLTVHGVAKFPKDPLPRYLLALALQRQGRIDEARASIVKTLELDPSYAPALAALITLEARAGRSEDALRAAARCLTVSMAASECVAARARIHAEDGDCRAMHADTTRWLSIDPTSASAHFAQANALTALEAPTRTVELVLARRWTLLPEGERAAAEATDRASLALVDGRLTDAREHAERARLAVPAHASIAEFAGPARLLATLLHEAGDTAGAADAAQAFLDQAAALPPHPLLPDPSVSFFEHLYRAGRIDRAELDARRRAWEIGEGVRTAGASVPPALAWARWALVWGDFAESDEEAREALAHVPEGVPMPPPDQASIALDFDLGKVLVLAGRAQDATSRLEAVARDCHALRHAPLRMRASVLLGRAHEALGASAEAKAAYERVVAGWRHEQAQTSRTRREAVERLAMLDRR